jgi:Transcriptional regulators
MTYGRNTMEPLSDLEFRALEILREDSRISIEALARELGISRSTASRILTSLRKRGVRFTVEATFAGQIAFVLGNRRLSDESYRTLDGRFISVLRFNSISELTEKLRDPGRRSRVIIASPVKKILTHGLRCDYCGGEIGKEPLTYRRGRRTYYLCCKTCLSQLRERFKRRSNSIAQK